MRPLCAAVFVSLAAICCSSIAAQETVETLIEQLESGERDQQREAAHALARLGAEAAQAVPALAKALSHNDLQVWQEATNALAHLGPAAAPAIPALVDRMSSSDEQRRYRTAYALGKIGETALPFLAERINDESRHTREVAICALGWLGAAADSVVPKLVSRLADDDAVVRDVASESLGKIGIASVPSLLDSLEHESAFVRAGAARALQAIGPPAEAATDSLIALTKDVDETVRTAALEAIVSVERSDARILPALRQAICESSSPPVQQAAINAFVGLSSELKHQVASELALELRSDDAALIQRVAIVLSDFGPLAEEALPALLDQYAVTQDAQELASAVGRIGEAALTPTFDALRQARINSSQVARIVESMPAQVREHVAMAIDDESPDVREVAALTIGRMIPLPNEATSMLGGHLRDPHVAVRIASAQSLARIGVKARSALPRLLEALEDEQQPAGRIAILQAISALESDSGKLIGLLTKLLRDPSHDVRQTVLIRLGQHDDLPDSLYAQLSELAVHDAPSMRAAAIPAIARVSTRREDTVHLLIAALGDDDQAVRQKALLAFAYLGAQAHAAIEQIQRQLQDESPQIRIAAVGSLTSMGTAAEPAFDQLAGLSDDEHLEVRVALVKNLHKLTKDTEKLLAVFVRSLGDDEWSVRRYAAEQLGEMEEAATPAIPALLELLRRDDDSEAARRAIRNIGTAGDEAIPILLDILQDDKAGRRSKYYSLYLLRQMGSRATAALPVLRELRSKSDGSQRDYLDQAIREIEEKKES